MCIRDRVDAGGGGTVAMYLANLDIDVVDLGVPVLSMHAPFEMRTTATTPPRPRVPSTVRSAKSS